MPFNLEQAIEDFWQARLGPERVPSSYFDKLSLADSYRIQLGLVARRIAAGEIQRGWKVGLTAKAIQEQFGFHEPVFGCILEARSSGHAFAAESLIAPGFETELCLRIARPLAGKVSVEAVRAAVDRVHPAFEITEARVDFARQPAVGLADNAQQHSVVIGPGVPLGPGMALEEVEARVMLNGREVATGKGAAVLGSPLNSIAWLAHKLAAFDRHLQAGDLVMTGAFVRQFPLKAGDLAVAEFSGIGRVQLAVT